MARALLLHGLPDPDTDPVTQLTAIASLCTERGIAVQNHRWASGSKPDNLRLLLALRRGTFLAQRIPAVAEAAIRPFLASLPPNERGIMIAYSAGAAIFYGWVCQNAQPAELARISTVIAIAGPHRFPRPVILENADRSQIPVNEPDLIAREIATRLAAHHVQLNVALGGLDDTIPPPYGRFPKGPHIQELFLADATHKSMLADTRLLDTIKNWLA